MFYDVMWAVMLFKLNVQSSDSLWRLLILEYAAPCHFLNAGSKIWDENERWMAGRYGTKLHTTATTREKDLIGRVSSRNKNYVM
jgi:hypothetical protein